MLEREVARPQLLGRGGPRGGRVDPGRPPAAPRARPGSGVTPGMSAPRLAPLRRRSAWRLARAALGLALLRALAVTSHASACLLVRGVLPAPTAVLAELDPVRIVPLGLLGLIVPPLALLACEGDGDSDVSASHGSKEGGGGRGRRKNPPRGEGGGSRAGRRGGSRGGGGASSRVAPRFAVLAPRRPLFAQQNEHETPRHPG